MSKTRGEIKDGEYHPAADSAMRYIKQMNFKDLVMWKESFASCAIEGNRLAEICSETLDRLTMGQPVSDRYLLGLAWTMASEKRVKSNKTKGLTEDGGG